MVEKKIMSVSTSEFFRSLTHLAPTRSFDINETHFHFPQDEGDASISFSILPDRQVTGLLSLPQMEVIIELKDMPDEACIKFMNEFDLAFRRGGG